MNVEAEQKDIRDLAVRDKRAGLEHIANACICRPESVTCCCTELAEDGQHGSNIPWPIQITGVAGDPDETVFGERAGDSGIPAPGSEPTMRCLVMDMHRSTQRQQPIHVQQEDDRGTSSRNWLTTSSVTTRASGWRGNKGTLLRVVSPSFRDNACRARSETTCSIETRAACSCSAGAAELQPEDPQYCGETRETAKL